MRILMIRSLDSHGPNVFVASHLKESLGRWYRLEAQLSKKAAWMVLFGVVTYRSLHAHSDETYWTVMSVRAWQHGVSSGFNGFTLVPQLVSRGYQHISTTEWVDWVLVPRVGCMMKHKTKQAIWPKALGAPFRITFRHNAWGPFYWLIHLGNLITISQPQHGTGMPLSSGSFAYCRSCVCCERQTDQIRKRIFFHWLHGTWVGRWLIARFTSVHKFGFRRQ